MSRRGRLLGAAWAELVGDDAGVEGKRKMGRFGPAMGFTISLTSDVFTEEIGRAAGKEGIICGAEGRPTTEIAPAGTPTLTGDMAEGGANI
jgi:hypothetical protein